MKDYFTAPHRPDSLAGAVVAFEGLRKAHALINGPLGCKTYLAHLIQLQDPQFFPNDIAKYLTNYHFGQPRASCTYIDEYDYIHGAEEKIKGAIHALNAEDYGLLGVINSCGTSLTGDDLVGFIKSAQPKFPTVAIDSTGFTGSFAEGFKKATIEILKAIVKKSSEKIPSSINIIGSTIFHYNWENDVAELKRTLELLGVKVLSVMSAGETIDNLKQSSKAELNLVVYEEYGDTVAKFLEAEFGIPSLGASEMAPFGLAASENWFGLIADHFGFPRQKIESESKRVRMKCYGSLERVSSLTGGLKGLTFAVFGDSSQVAPLTVFFHKYLGMYPDVIGVREMGKANRASIERYIKENSLDTTFLVSPDQYAIRETLLDKAPNLILGSSIEERILETLENKRQAFMPVSFPYTEKVMLTYRPLMGFNGVLTLVEDALNSLKRLGPQY
jgi:light-independent protochlorophyllide reductase B subunit